MRSASRFSGLFAFLFLVAVAAAVAWEGQPSGYRTADAPADVFSAERAMRTIEEIAQQPHPPGTPEHARVREYLADELRKLGLQTEIQEGIGRWPTTFEREGLALGQVFNIVASKPGTASTGTVYLTAHYDSVPSGPGANDDGAGIAAILEAVRALGAAPDSALRNDLVVLLTDGEENGLLGAEAFVAAGQDGKRTGVVINHEARGASGPVLLWRITHPDGHLIDAVAAAPHPNTDSLSTALGGAQTSSNTDFVSFEPGGLQVLDWAFAGSSAYYHNRLDDPAHVNPATVQQMGDNTLALAREYGDTDLATLSGGSDRSYFQLPFGILIVLPIWVIIALAVVSVALLAWVAWTVRRNGETKLRKIFAAGATFLLAVPVAMGAVYLLWEALQFIRPEYRTLEYVDPYRPESYYAAVLMLSATVLAVWWLLARRLFDTTASAVGLLGAVTVVGVACTVLVPSGAQMLIVPLFAAAIGFAVTFVVPQPWRLPTLTLFLIPAAIFLGGASWAVLQTGVSASPFMVAPLVVLLGGLVTVTLVRTWPPRRSWLIPTTTLTLTIALSALGLFVDRFDAEHPLPSQLLYAFDADGNEARWLSQREPNRWTDEFVDAAAPGAQFAELWPNAVASGPAPTSALPPPTAEIVSDTTDSGQRTVTLRVKSARDGIRLDLRFDSAVEALRVGGREVTPVPAQGFQFFAPPAEGLDVELVAPAGPVSLRLIDYTWLTDSGLDFFGAPPADIYLRENSTAAVFVAVRGL
ncbi:M20/M25/M40 family metallo-hydrolase [Nocardia uniformis]|uniref:Vacuolar membrane protease n=1 Tax=Nocardia uniformis TaxID=53432 RepID=A0A849C6A4_9NOCA|nr:M20/M25/M40 family metallo-hydrolase [Nocardia uniformis]NNH74263.1 M20/M25/M40 family metallo-hydrolase [Nocardia uniformis]